MEWLKQAAYTETRGRKAGTHRKYSEEVDQRIRNLKQSRVDDNRYFVGSPHVQMDYANKYPKDSLPTVSHIQTVVRDAGLQTRKPKKRVQGGSAYLLYPVESIRKLGYIHQSADFIGRKYIAGKTEPVNIFSTSYYFPFKLYQIKRILAEKVDYSLDVLRQSWCQYPIPDVFRMDNGLQFRGTASGKRSAGKFLRFLLNLKVIPLFGAPCKPWTNPHVEGHNRVFNEKVWRRNFFTNLNEVDRECERFNQESCDLLRFKYAWLITNGSFRYLAKRQALQMDTLESVRGKKVYFIRFVESYETRGVAHIIVLNEIVFVPEQYDHQFVFVEWDLGKALLNIYSEYQGVGMLIHQVKFMINI